MNAAFDQVPECTERDDLVRRCRRYLDDRSDDFKGLCGDTIWHAFAVASPMPSAIQELEPEPEPKPEPSRRRARGTRRARERPLPNDFTLTEKMAEAIGKAGRTDPVAAFEQFCNYHRAHDKHFADWQAAWRTWVGNHGRYGCACQRAGGVTTSGEPNRQRVLALHDRAAAGDLS